MDLLAAQQRFVAEELASFQQYLLDVMRAKVRNKNIRASDALLSKLATSVSANEVRLSFPTHGRFHDMGAGRGYEKGHFIGNEARVEALKGRKPSKWYSRAAYGSVYGTLANNLANKFIAELPGAITNDFNSETDT